MNNCEFCNHSEEMHKGSFDFKNGCNECNKCAVYSPPGTKDRYNQLLVDLDTPVTITPKQLGLKIHELRTGHVLDEHGMMSCPCDLMAMYYLGVRESTGVF